MRFASPPSVFAAIAVMGLTASAAEAAPVAVARYKDWTVYRDGAGSNTVCYAATAATDKAPKTAEHGEVWFYVSSWRTGQARRQPSLKVGYELRADIPGQASVGRSRYRLYGIGQEAFTDDTDDADFVNAIRRGKELRIEAVSARNTSVAYHFSLSGSADAIDKAASACG